MAVVENTGQEWDMILQSLDSCLSTLHKALFVCLFFHYASPASGGLCHAEIALMMLASSLIKTNLH